MPTLLILRVALILGSMLSLDLFAAQAVPAVYRDDYLAIRSGVAEIGLRPIHLGDTITFVVQLEFDAGQVRVESLDDDFFLRAFAETESISLYAPVLVNHEETGNGRVTVGASWPVQILGCPDGQTNCRGDKHYELPVIAISYQIIDETGAVANDKSARFRPGPGVVAVATALAATHGPAGEFLDYFPGGAHPQVLPVERRGTAGTAAVIAGILLLVVGFNSRSPEQAPSKQVAHSHLPANRWERAFASLQNDSMPDDQWADLLRRCASWYCLDELGRSPHALRSTEFDRFFAELAEQERIGADQRAAYLDRFTRLASEEGS